MLVQHDDESIKHGEPVRSSQLDLSKLRAVIKQTYYQLDKDLKKLVKDQSGCVCVSLFVCFFVRENLLFSSLLFSTDNLSNRPWTNLFD